MDVDQGMGCERCGVIFMTLNHLMGHIKECCKGSKPAGTNQPMDEGSSASDGENQEEGESVSDGENQEESAFYNFRLEAINRVRESKDWEDKYNDFVRAGEEEDNACELADGEFEKRIVKIAEKMYRRYLTNALLLQYGDVHGKVREALLEYWDKGYNARKASKLAVNDHLVNVRVLLEDEDEEEDSTDESEDSTDED